MPSLEPFAKFQVTLEAIATKLAEHGYRCYVVGGATRDYFLGKESLDIDLATDALPKQVQKIFKSTIPTGIQHGTVTIIYHNIPFEITTFRLDGDYLDARRPENVIFIDRIDEDLKRRDFTINAIAYDILAKEFYDPLGGINAIRNKEIKAIGEPALRFQEDLLRVLRGIRFMAQLDQFSLDEATKRAMQLAAPDLLQVSKERILKEIRKIFSAKDPRNALEMARDIGILPTLFKEINHYYETPQALTSHWQPLLAAIYLLPPDHEDLRLALFFSQLSPYDANIEGYQQDYRSSQLASKLLTLYRESNQHRLKIVTLIKHQYLSLLDLWSGGDIRRWLAVIGVENWQDLLTIHKAWHQALGESLESSCLFEQQVKTILSHQPALSIQELAINGNDLMANGIASGREIGEILQQLLELVLDDPEFNTKSALLQAAKFFMTT